MDDETREMIEVLDRYCWGMLSKEEFLRYIMQIVTPVLDSIKDKVNTISGCKESNTSLSEYNFKSFVSIIEHIERYTSAKEVDIHSCFRFMLFSHIRRNANTKIFDLVWAVFCAIQLFPFCGSWFYTPAEVERGIEIELPKSQIIVSQENEK